MKTIGLIGGMSWESSVTYYQVINQIIKQELGGLHSAHCILYSVDFHQIEQCQASGDWDKSAEILSAAALKLQQAGADFIVICTNTMHKVAKDIQAHITIPIIHIANATAQALKSQSLDKVALLGTKYTMEQDFYKKIIIDHGIDIIVPEQNDRDIINNIIFQELCLGTISISSKNILLNIIDKLAAAGAQGIILGCTELGLLIEQNDTQFPLFDTTLIHASNAAYYALGIDPYKKL
ncbi:aspartate/glutamate racemase family protein [Orbus sturtevantii]|uniref:aspartate/glutamate racemase family protein n=1 Tax=Orbus sturtevantii TaxID=3074109 RepID=UPI00370DC6A1